MDISINWPMDVVKDLYIKGVISPADNGWTEEHSEAVRDVPQCSHIAEIMTSIIYKCMDCGRIHQVPINSEIQENISYIRQGLIPVADVVESLSLSVDMAAYLKALPVCDHLSKIEYNCKDGHTRLRCTSCGRKYA
jgi:hypothetical protein